MTAIRPAEFVLKPLRAMVYHTTTADAKRSRI